MGLSTVDIINILQYASSCGIKGKSLCMMGKQDLYMDIRNIPFSIAILNWREPFIEDILYSIPQKKSSIAQILF